MESEAKERIVRVGKQVEQVLRDCEPARNSDQLLAWRVWQDFYGIGSFVTFDDWMDKLPSFETVRRTRAKIQNDEGRFLPTDETVRVRRGLQEVWQRNMQQLDLFENRGDRRGK